MSGNSIGTLGGVALGLGTALAVLPSWITGFECAAQTVAHELLALVGASGQVRQRESCGARTAHDSSEPRPLTAASRPPDVQWAPPRVRLAAAALERAADPPARADSPQQRAEAWLSDVHRIYCEHDADREFLQALSRDPTLSVVVLAEKVERPASASFDGSKWVLDYREWAGMLDGGVIYLSYEGTLAERVGFLYHERIHALQPEDMPLAEREYWAYRKTAEWLEQRGLPQIPRDFFVRNAAGQRVIDEQAIRDFVRENYPEHGRPEPLTSSDEGDGRTWFVVGHSGTGQTVICPSASVDFDAGACKLREPRSGDRYTNQFDQSLRLPGAVTLPKERLRCPAR